MKSQEQEKNIFPFLDTPEIKPYQPTRSLAREVPKSIIYSCCNLVSNLNKELGWGYLSLTAMSIKDLLWDTLRWSDKPGSPISSVVKFFFGHQLTNNLTEAYY